MHDSLVRKVTGTWQIKNDSLLMAQIHPEKSTYVYQLTIIGNRATFIGIIDFDGDGKNDDSYYGVQEKFK